MFFYIPSPRINFSEVIFLGYRVEYGSVKKVRGLEKRFSRVSALTALCILLFCILVGTFWPKGRDVLRSLVFPGDPVVTAAAFEDMAEQLREGENLSDALHAFCAQVLEGAALDTDR